MKIKPEHYTHMLEALRTVLTQPGAPTAAQYAANSIGTDPAKRHRWDAARAAGLIPYICDTLYTYANDDHIDTALKHAVKELQP